MIQMWDEDDDEDYAYPEQDGDPPDLGPCCGCGKEDKTVRNIGMLDFRAPIAGKGWGCVQCGLPQDGALVVVCDECAATEKPYKWIISGLTGDKQRIEYAGFEQVPFTHDMSKHPEIF